MITAKILVIVLDVKAKYDHAFSLACEGKLDLIPQDLMCRFSNYYKQVYNEKKITCNLSPGYKHDWFYGISGSGKSRCARESYPNAYLKGGRTKWWDGYRGEDVVLIEDLDRRDADYMVYNLKIWLDMYPFPAEVKGGSLGVIRPKHVVITSNWSPSELWKDKQDLDPILRRVSVLEFPLPLSLKYVPKKYNV